MKLNKSGYTLVEVMVVCTIIALLAAIGTPIYMHNIYRAKATEAVGTMSMIRESLRDYRVRHNNYYDITSPNISHAFPTSVASGIPDPADAGADVNAGTAQYFSNASFTVDATTPASANFTSPPPVDFIIYANGSLSVQCSGALTDCAFRANNVVRYRLEMDNSGRTFVSYDGGTTYRPW